MKHPNPIKTGDRNMDGMDSRPVRSSFAGTLAGAMRREHPPLTADEASLLTRELLTERDVEDLLQARRLPTAEEVVLVADALDVMLGELFGHQRTTRRSDGASKRREVTALVSMELRVTPENRGALRLRKATTGSDIGGMLIDIMEESLADEFSSVRGLTKR